MHSCLLGWPEANAQQNALSDMLAQQFCTRMLLLLECTAASVHTHAGAGADCSMAMLQLLTAHAWTQQYASNAACMGHTHPIRRGAQS